MKEPKVTKESIIKTTKERIEDYSNILKYDTLSESYRDETKRRIEFYESIIYHLEN